MAIREEAVFLNGVYEVVIKEILIIQQEIPEQVMFLQPYSSERIVKLAENPPSVEDRVRLFLSLTTDLSTINYVAEIVGWDNKTELPPARAHAISRLSWTLQPDEGGLYHVGKGETTKSVNLLHVWRMRKLEKSFSVSELIVSSTGEPHSSKRTTAGGWSYVQYPSEDWLAKRL